MLNEENQSKLTEGEDFYTPEGYKCYRKHHLKGAIVVKVALWF
jgi:hypothetical protein